MTDVVPLRGGQIPRGPQGEPNQQIVSHLERLLEEARAGQICSFAWCVYKSIDELNHGWVTGDYAFHLGAGILVLQHAYVKVYDEREREGPKT